MTELLNSREISALKYAIKIYRFKGKLEKKAINYIFKQATGKELGSLYYGIPVVRELLELQG